MDGLESFLAERGALDVLFRLAERPLGFNELKASIHISPNTLLARIKEATKFGLVEETLVRTEKRSLIKYKLTREGRKTIDGLGNIKKKYLEIKAELDKIKSSENEKEKELEEVLSSKIKSNVSISNVKGGRDVHIDVNSESSTKQNKE
jgi:DNA-binding HxlR family transcriptional regulator